MPRGTATSLNLHLLESCMAHRRQPTETLHLRKKPVFNASFLTNLLHKIFKTDLFPLGELRLSAPHSPNLWELPCLCQLEKLWGRGERKWRKEVEVTLTRRGVEKGKRQTDKWMHKHCWDTFQSWVSPVCEIGVLGIMGDYYRRTPVQPRETIGALTLQRIFGMLHMVLVRKLLEHLCHLPVSIFWEACCWPHTLSTHPSNATVCMKLPIMTITAQSFPLEFPSSETHSRSDDVFTKTTDFVSKFVGQSAIYYAQKVINSAHILVLGAFLLELDTSIAIAMPGWRTNLLLREHLPRTPPIFPTCIRNRRRVIMTVVFLPVHL